MWKTADHFCKISPNEQVPHRLSDFISLLGDGLKATKRESPRPVFKAHGRCPQVEGLTSHQELLAKTEYVTES